MITVNDFKTVSILVNSSSNGNVAPQKIVSFQVSREGQQYKAIPMLYDEEIKGLGLPEIISFTFVDNCIIPAKSMNENTIEIIKNIIREFLFQDAIN